MHASLAITPEGLPLGLTAAKFWSREKFRETTGLKRKINPTRVPIDQKESMRWLDNFVPPPRQVLSVLLNPYGSTYKRYLRALLPSSST